MSRSYHTLTVDIEDKGMAYTNWFQPELVVLTPKTAKRIKHFQSKLGLPSDEATWAEVISHERIHAIVACLNPWNEKAQLQLDTPKHYEFMMKAP